MIKRCVIYRAYFPNGKSYVGQSWDFATRRRKHKKAKGCRALYAAIKKHGEPRYEIMYRVDNQRAANTLEMFWIAYHKAKGDCYNLKDGGANGRHSDVTKQKISVTKKNNPIPEESRRRIIEAHIGRKHTEEHKQKISRALKGRKKPPEVVAKIARANTGKKRTAEQKKAQSLARIGKRLKPHTEETKAKMRVSAKLANARPEVRRRKSESKRGCKNGMWGKPAWNRGKKMSPEFREKCRLRASRPRGKYKTKHAQKQRALDIGL